MNTPFGRLAAQRSKTLTIVAALLIGGLWPVRGVAADINEQVARLNLDKATLEDVIQVFGEPKSYAWEGKTFTRDSLPSVYILNYTDSFQVLMLEGRIGELRFQGADCGYAYRGKLRVGSSLEEALAVVGPPARTVEGGLVEGQDGVLYKDVDGMKGDCYYSRADQHIRLFFDGYKVAGLCLTVRQRRGELDAGGTPAKLSEQPAGPMTFPKIDRRPAPCDLQRGSLGSVPKYDPANGNSFQVDLRSYDLSQLDLREAAIALTHANFDDRTVWPASDRLPRASTGSAWLNWARTPDCGVRSLHAQGITGRGVGIAIIDNPLLTDHQEYAERLRLYEEDNVRSESEAHMHGPAVASIAVGKTVGVAPEADLYYIGRWAFDAEAAAGGQPPVTSKYEAEAIQRFLQINEQLPPDRKIRVISISFGWNFGQTGLSGGHRRRRRRPRRRECWSSARPPRRSTASSSTAWDATSCPIRMILPPTGRRGGEADCTRITIGSWFRWTHERRPVRPARTSMRSMAKAGGVGPFPTSPGLTPWRLRSIRRSRRSGSGPWR